MEDFSRKIKSMSLEELKQELESLNFRMEVASASMFSYDPSDFHQSMGDLNYQYDLVKREIYRREHPEEFPEKSKKKKFFLWQWFLDQLRKP